MHTQGCCNAGLTAVLGCLCQIWKTTTCLVLSVCVLFLNVFKRRAFFIVLISEVTECMHEVAHTKWRGNGRGSRRFCKLARNVGTTWEWDITPQKTREEAGLMDLLFQRGMSYGRGAWKSRGHGVVEDEQAGKEQHSWQREAGCGQQVLSYIHVGRLLMSNHRSCRV